MAFPRSIGATFLLLAFLLLCPRGGSGAEPNVPGDPKYLDGWRMAGANPERTSWVPEDVSGKLQLEWYRPFEPFISHKVQVIAADGMLLEIGRASCRERV